MLFETLAHEHVIDSNICTWLRTRCNVSVSLGCFSCFSLCDIDLFFVCNLSFYSRGRNTSCALEGIARSVIPRYATHTNIVTWQPSVQLCEFIHICITNLGLHRTALFWTGIFWPLTVYIHIDTMLSKSAQQGYQRVLNPGTFEAVSTGIRELFYSTVTMRQRILL